MDVPSPPLPVLDAVLPTPPIASTSAGTGSASPLSGPSAPPPKQVETGQRIRHLRACDRCRRRKIKCDENSPCSRCSDANVDCTFTFGTKILAVHPADSAQKKRKADEAPAADPPEPLAAPTSLLSLDETASFFTTPEGFARCCGSTSGLPLLEATLRLSRLQLSAKTATEPDWAWLPELLNAGRLPPSGTADGSPTEQDFFPGREVQPKEEHDAHNLILELIPVDLLGVLIQIFFEVIHPQWPILHIPTFLKSTHKWKEPAFAALVLSMCMLASRYCADPRVRAQPDNPASAGYHYVAAFRKLREAAALGNDDAVEAIVSLFFACQYHCVDNLPHPIAQGLLGDAVARVYDGGLNRNAKLPGLGNAIELEVRKRAAWAVFCFEKSLAAVAGRMPLMPLVSSDFAMPAPFPRTPSPSSSSADSTTTPMDDVAFARDAADCETFAQLVRVSALLEKCIAACWQPPDYKDPFLAKLGGTDRWRANDDLRKPAEVEAWLDEWASNLPPSLRERNVDLRARLPSFGPQNETVLALEQTCRLILSSRRLQLTTSALAALDPADTTRSATLRIELRKHRGALLMAVQQLVASGVKLGAAGFLNRCDIYLGYRLLLAGRLTLAACLSAQEDADAAQEATALQTLEQCLLLLTGFAAAFPVSLGAAETLKETCRVCNVALPKTALETSSHGRYAWHRPLPRRSVTAMQPGVRSSAAPAAAFTPTTGVRDVPVDLDSFSRHSHPAAPTFPPPPPQQPPTLHPPVFPPYTAPSAAAPPALAQPSFTLSQSQPQYHSTNDALSELDLSVFSTLPEPPAGAFSPAPSPAGLGMGQATENALAEWVGLLDASPSPTAAQGDIGVGGGAGEGLSPSAGAGAGYGLGSDLSDLSWLWPGGMMPQL